MQIVERDYDDPLWQESSYIQFPMILSLHHSISSVTLKSVHKRRRDESFYIDVAKNGRNKDDLTRLRAIFGVPNAFLWLQESDCTSFITSLFSHPRLEVLHPETSSCKEQIKVSIDPEFGFLTHSESMSTRVSQVVTPRRSHVRSIEKFVNLQNTLWGGNRRSPVRNWIARSSETWP